MGQLGKTDCRTWRLVLTSLLFQKDGRLTANSQQRRARFITRSLIARGLIKLPPLIRSFFFLELGVDPSKYSEGLGIYRSVWIFCQSSYQGIFLDSLIRC